MLLGICGHTDGASGRDRAATIPRRTTSMVHYAWRCEFLPEQSGGRTPIGIPARVPPSFAGQPPSAPRLRSLQQPPSVLRVRPARGAVLRDLAARRGPGAQGADVDYAETYWRRWTDHHGNAWFSWLWFVMGGTPPDEEELRALYELRGTDPTLALAARRPLGAAQHRRGDLRHHGRLGASGLSAQAHGVFGWEKEPWAAGAARGGARPGDSTGLDFLAAYWLGRAHGFIAR